MAAQSREDGPCGPCRAGLHRICKQPVSIPTLLAYFRATKRATVETFTCCDRKEFWTAQVFE